MTLLDQIIDGATSDTVGTANLLRKIHIVSHRLQAPELLAWIDGELNGYTGQQWPVLPSYRGPLICPVSALLPVLGAPVPSSPFPRTGRLTGSRISFSVSVSVNHSLNYNGSR